MIKIDKELFQWETERKAIITSSAVSFVYFYNKKESASRREEVINNSVKIPNVLLKESLPITALCCDEEKKVIGRKIFKVLAAKRPEDYIDIDDPIEIIYDGGVE